jgi:hypothetical protein
MRVTLDELKAMSALEIQQRWARSIFPFDGARKCNHCMTSHHGLDTEFCSAEEHGQLRKQAHDFWSKAVEQAADKVFVGEIIKDNIEQFYALRLFYDSLYPQLVTESVPEPEEQVVY